MSDYIEHRIKSLELGYDSMWSKLCKLEHRLDDCYIDDRVSALEDIVENDGRKIDELAERVNEIHGMCIHDEPQVQQTMDEFVRIVRCKDCKWYIKDTTDPYFYDGCKNEDGIFRPSGEDYCSKGEKK